MKILNLHGFMGEADNKNYKALCALIPVENILSPQLKYIETSPSELLRQLSDMVSDDNYVFVGQSLGGWYADKLSRSFKCPCILTNPCYSPHLLEIISGSGIPEQFIEEYRQLSVSDKNEIAYTVCSDADKILPDNYSDCIRLSETVRCAHGSHSTIDDLTGHISELLAEINNRLK
jgi:predicted esterase YcpF (UPF0227 family)